MARLKQRRRKRWRFTGLRVFLKLHSAHATFGAVLALTEMPKERRHSAVRDELAANTFRDLARKGKTFATLFLALGLGRALQPLDQWFQAADGGVCAGAAQDVESL